MTRPPRPIQGPMARCAGARVTTVRRAHRGCVGAEVAHAAKDGDCKPCHAPGRLPGRCLHAQLVACHLRDCDRRARLVDPGALPIRLGRVTRAGEIGPSHRIVPQHVACRRVHRCALAIEIDLAGELPIVRRRRERRSRAGERDLDAVGVPILARPRCCRGGEEAEEEAHCYSQHTTAASRWAVGGARRASLGLQNSCM
eukprot:3092734-Prymnesium_polylepis.2